MNDSQGHGHYPQNVPTGPQGYPPQQPGQWTPGQPGQYQQGGYPQSGPGFAPAQPSFFSRLPLSVLLGVGSSLAGIITFFMGFVAWISIDRSIEAKFEAWANENENANSIDIPAYLTPSLVTSPGFYFILLGAVGFASLGLIVPTLRKFLPYLTFLALVGWLCLLTAAMGLPAFIGIGAGAIVGLIFGFIQLALLAAATFVEGLRENK